MLCSILFGASSLSATKALSTDTVSHLWGVKFVTPGAIAFVSILVCFLHQTTVIIYWFCGQAIFLHLVDETLEPTGHNSGIQYQKLFSTYKQIIMMKLTEEKDENVKDMLGWYNSQVFHWFQNSTNKDHDGSLSSGIDKVLNQMDVLDINDPEIGPHDNNDWGSEQVHSAGAQVCFHAFFLFFGWTDQILRLLKQPGTHPKTTRWTFQSTWWLTSTTMCYVQPHHGWHRGQCWR